MIKPSQSFNNDVYPNYLEYINDPTREWKAKNAYQAFNNHLEWTFKYYKENDPARLPGGRNLKDFRQDIFFQCSELEIIWDLADAAKHRFLTQIPRSFVTSSTAAHFVGQNDIRIDPSGHSMKQTLSAAERFWRNWVD